METYLPLIKSLIAEWVQLTIDNPLYAGVLVIAVWLLTASLYSYIIVSLKKKLIASDSARIDMESRLNGAQQQAQQMQEELTATTEQLHKAQQRAENEAQRAAGLEEQLLQRNKQVAAIIQALATGFDLGERPVPITEDIKAENLWQQHDRVITLLSTRLRNEQQAKMELQQAYQTETLKRAENEAVIATLQTSLGAQTVQVSQLELALDAQKVMQQQQQELAQQILSQTLEKHLAELARLTELEQQALASANTKQQLSHKEDKLTAQDAQISRLETTQSTEPVKAPPAAVSAPVETAAAVEPATPEETAPPAVKPQPVSPAKNPLGKLKGLFGKTKPAPVAAAPVAAEIVEEASKIQFAPLEVEQPPVTPPERPLGKVKHYFGEAQQPAEVIKLEIQPEPSTIKQPAKGGQLGKIKGLFGKKQPVEAIKAEAPEIQPEPLPVEPSAKSGQLGKLKGLFGKKK